MYNDDRIARIPAGAIFGVFAIATAALVGWVAWVFIHDDDFDTVEDIELALWSPDATPVARIQSIELWAGRGREAVPELVPGLSNPSAKVRSSVALALGRIGPAAHPAIPGLMDALRDPEPSVRENSLLALRSVGADFGPAMPALIALLADRKDSIRNEASDALVRCGVGALPTLCAAVDAPQPLARRQIAIILYRMGILQPVVAAALETLWKDRHMAVRAESFKALVRMGFVTADQVGQALRDEADPVVDEGLGAVVRFGPRAAATLPEVRRLLKESRARSSEPVLAALAAIGPQAQPAIADVLPFLGDPHAATRAAAGRTLARIGMASNVLVPLLAQIVVNDSDASVALQAADVLREIDAGAARALVPRIVERLRTGDVLARQAAAGALGGLGIEARSAVAPLCGALHDADSRVVGTAACALGRIGPGAAAAAPELIKLLKAPGTAISMRAVVIESIGTIGLAADAVATPVLVAAYREHEHDPPLSIMANTRAGEAFDRESVDRAAVREQTLAALGNIGIATREVEAVLRRALDHSAPGTRWSACLTLGRLNLDPALRLSLLTRALGDPHSAVRSAAAIGLRGLGSPAPTAAEALVAALSDRNPFVRTTAAQALAKFEGAAPSAVPELLKLLAEDRSSMRNIDWPRLGGDDSPLPPFLEPLKFDTVRVAALAALRVIDPVAAKEADVEPPLPNRTATR